MNTLPIFGEYVYDEYEFMVLNNISCFFKPHNEPLNTLLITNIPILLISGYVIFKLVKYNYN